MYDSPLEAWQGMEDSQLRWLGASVVGNGESVNDRSLEVNCCLPGKVGCIPHWRKGNYDEVCTLGILYRTLRRVQCIFMTIGIFRGIPHEGQPHHDA